jgi:hypothetical protein
VSRGLGDVYKRQALITAADLRENPLGHTRPVTSNPFQFPGGFVTIPLCN